jgi:hypothetical protein
MGLGLARLFSSGCISLVLVGLILARTSSVSQFSSMDGLLMISQLVLGVEGLIAHATDQRRLFHFHFASGLVVLRHNVSFRPR